MVSNLLVVLCGERGAQPIVNTGNDLSVIESPKCGVARCEVRSKCEVRSPYEVRSA
jgi:hypothetical protein